MVGLSLFYAQCLRPVFEPTAGTIEHETPRACGDFIREGAVQSPRWGLRVIGTLHQASSPALNDRNPQVANCQAGRFAPAGARASGFAPSLVEHL